MNTQFRSNAVTPGAFRQRQRKNPRHDRWQGALIVATMHLAVLAGLWTYQPAREALASAMPIMVNLITLPPPEEHRDRPKAVANPVPVQSRPEPQTLPQIVAAPVEAPAPYIAPPPQPEPPRPVAPATVTAPVLVALPSVTPPPVTPPRFDAAYLDNPAPSYPSMSRRLQEHGKVVLRVLVAAAGIAERVEVRSSSGSNRLDSAALETVKRWRFVPAKQGADAVAAWVLVPISFSLEG